MTHAQQNTKVAHGHQNTLPVKPSPPGKEAGLGYLPLTLPPLTKKEAETLSTLLDKW